MQNLTMKLDKKRNQYYHYLEQFDEYLCCSLLLLISLKSEIKKRYYNCVGIHVLSYTHG